MPRFIPLSPETQKALEKLHADPVAHGLAPQAIKNKVISGKSKAGKILSALNIKKFFTKK